TASRSVTRNTTDGAHTFTGIGGGSGFRGGGPDHAEGDARAAEGQRLYDHRLGVHAGFAVDFVCGGGDDIRPSGERILQAPQKIGTEPDYCSALKHSHFGAIIRLRPYFPYS